MFYDDDDDDKDAKRSTFLLRISLLSNINRQTRFTQSSAESSYLAHVRTLLFSISVVIHSSLSLSVHYQNSLFDKPFHPQQTKYGRM